MRLEESGKNDLAEAFYGWFKEVLAMNEASDKRTAPKLSVPERMKLSRELAQLWNDPKRIARQEGFDEGFDAGFEAGQTEVLDIIRIRLYRTIAEISDPEMFGRLTTHLDQRADPALFLVFSQRLHEGATCATLLEQLESWS